MRVVFEIQISKLKVLNYYIPSLMIPVQPAGKTPTPRHFVTLFINTKIDGKLKLCTK
jgi:hypothetical protein